MAGLDLLYRSDELRSRSAAGVAGDASVRWRPNASVRAKLGGRACRCRWSTGLGCRCQPVWSELARDASLVVTVEDNGRRSGAGVRDRGDSGRVGVQVPVVNLGIPQQFLAGGQAGGHARRVRPDGRGIAAAVESAPGSSRRSVEASRVPKQPDHRGVRSLIVSEGVVR